MNAAISLDFDEHPILYYDEDHNVFVDDGGYIIFDIFRIITPNILLVFKTKKEDMSIDLKPEQIGVITQSRDKIRLVYNTPFDIPAFPLRCDKFPEEWEWWE